jgi:2-oxoisovalerate dehydrogenase E1 component
MPALSKEDKLRLLTLLLESRHGDLREQNLNRQGKGHFHVSGMGHEALAALGMQLRDGDYISGYYRDRGLVLGRGVASRELAIDYFAKRAGQSHGRQMPSHYSYAQKGIWSVPTPTGAQLLPACGLAWGIRLDGKPNVVITTIGDAASRQGDFYEAVAFAKERQLPVLFVVEDNKLRPSAARRRRFIPRALNVVHAEDWQVIDGSDPQAVYDAARKRSKRCARRRAALSSGSIWNVSRATRIGRPEALSTARELTECANHDPLRVWSERLIAEGVITSEGIREARQGRKERVRKNSRTPSARKIHRRRADAAG